MVKRPREHFFRNPARRPRTGPIGLDSLPPTLVEQVLSYIYPEGCLDFKQKRQLQRMAERMFEGFAHNHQVMVFVRRQGSGRADGQRKPAGRDVALPRAAGHLPGSSSRPLRGLLPLAAERAKHRPGAAARDHCKSPWTATATIISRKRPALTA